VPEFDDSEAFNEGLAEDCRGSPASPSREKGTKGELLEEDAGRLLPLPAQALQARRVEPCRPIRCRWSASTERLFSADAIRPSRRHGDRRDREGAFCGADRCGEHLRDWDKENVHYHPVHYLALLERKPGALDFGKPFDDTIHVPKGRATSSWRSSWHTDTLKSGFGKP